MPKSSRLFGQRRRRKIESRAPQGLALLVPLGRGNIASFRTPEPGVGFSGLALWALIRLRVEPAQLTQQTNCL